MSPVETMIEIGAGIHDVLIIAQWVAGGCFAVVAVLCLVRFGVIRHPWAVAVLAVVTAFLQGASDKQREAADEDDAAPPAPAAEPEPSPEPAAEPRRQPDRSG